MISTKKRVFLVSSLAMIVSSTVWASATQYQFTANAKEASDYTKQSNDAVYKKLDFNNKQAFEDVDRGFIAPLPDDGYIKGFADIPAMQFMQGKEAPATVNPSLWRHAQLVNRGGLYEVLPNKIYQVRGNDITNLTIIETDDGIVLYDIEYSPETLKKAYKLYEQYRGKRPLKAVIVSHSHTDHYGGITGIVDLGLASEKDFESGKVPVYVPEGFMKDSVGEMVLYGNVMSRRSIYQYGLVLPKNEKGFVTSALGPLVANGTNGLPKYVKEITHDNQVVNIDGVNFDFYLVPGSEAPSEMVFNIPEWGAISMAEDVNHLQHNIYSMRGTKTRDAGKWAQYIHEAIVRWQDNANVIFGPHTWPTWGQDNVVNFMKNQRDLYKAINDQTTRLANYGYRPDEIAQNIEIPDSIMNQWDNRDYYGNFKNNVIATYVNNLGWFDANPVSIAKHTYAESGQRYVESFGGEDVVVNKALEYFKKGDYAFTVQLLNHIESYNKDNKKANYLMADAFEQLGYQEESSLKRNWYLTAAQELRSDDLLPQPVNSAGPDVLNALPSNLMMDMFATRIVPQKSVDYGRLAFVFNVNGESFGVEIENGVMNTAKDYQPKDSVGIIETNNVTLFSILNGKTSIEDAQKNGSLKLSGDKALFGNFMSMLDANIPNTFNLVQPRMN
ncbi:TPA: MBL fold metallo-hydrolase [Vibrio parahaemolyticus]|nr:MBL fold metallo-hydrolase [Vibrio parahaemolyticus]EHH1097310.1 MBL fold metallo-hydrolase [Vibrio parahaemolyticus]EHH3742207.1 MBL fold metallo-hydrolase [Vibrio parahaemolyticus]EHJ9959199.1 MBL fold metallo-hydrolase [Vibrio parahaemolyticus]EHK0039762.1 MBL fold metallo-hydrolase [Vibrio parahaemolyticus]